MSCVEKLVVYLHESIRNHKRVFHRPPFIVKDEGYAGFTVTIEIYFRGLPSGDSGKMVKLQYDLCLIPDAKLITEGTMPDDGRETTKTRVLTIQHNNKKFLRMFEEGRISYTSSAPHAPTLSKGYTVSYIPTKLIFSQYLRVYVVSCVTYI